MRYLYNIQLKYSTFAKSIPKIAFEWDTWIKRLTIAHGNILLKIIVLFIYFWKVAGNEYSNHHFYPICILDSYNV